MSSAIEQIPTDVSAIYLDNTRIQINFTQPTGFVNSYYYKVVMYDNSGNYYDASGITSPIILTGLTESTIYNYYIETILTASSEIIIGTKTISFPIINSFNITDISYNALNLNWYGEDLSYIYINRFNNGYLPIDISYIYGSQTEFYDSIDLSGNTLYSYSIIPYSNLNNILYKGDTIIKTATTNVAPATDLSIIFYDSSSIIVSFTAGRNYYTNSIYYLVSASAEDVSSIIDNSGSGASDTTQTIKLDDLSGNTDYTISFTTVIDNSLNKTLKNSNTLSVKTDIQKPINSYIYSYDSSSVYISLGILPKNSFNNTIYYIIKAIDNSNNIFSSNITYSNALSNNIIKINALNNNTLYYITARTVVDDIYSDIFNIGSVKTTINTNYNIYVSEINNKSINDVSLNSILEISFNTITYTNINTNNVYYIISAKDTHNNIIDVSSSNGSAMIYGLSGNTFYTISINTIVDGSSVISPTTTTIKTAIQTPLDVVIDNFVDNSFTILFTAPRNTYNTDVYYILRATDLSSGTVYDISSETAILSMYNVPNIESSYDIDLITVVDNSMVSYGGLFTI